MSSGVHDIKFSLWSLILFLALSILSIRLAKRGRKLQIFAGILPDLVPEVVLSFWELTQYSDFVGRVQLIRRDVPHPVLQPHQAPWLMLGAQKFWGNVARCAPFSLSPWGSSSVGFATIRVILFGCTSLSQPSLFCTILHSSCHSPSSRKMFIEKREDLSLHFFPQDTQSVGFSKTNVRNIYRES